MTFPCVMRKAVGRLGALRHPATRPMSMSAAALLTASKVPFSVRAGDTEKARTESFDCRRSMFALRGTDGNFNQCTRPTLATSRYLVVARHSDGNCGGAYPFTGTEHTTFDLATVEIVDPWSWIEDANVEERVPPDALLHLIRSKGTRDTSDPADECLQTLASTDSYYPTRGSIRWEWSSRPTSPTSSRLVTRIISSPPTS